MRKALVLLMLGLVAACNDYPTEPETAAPTGPSPAELTGTGGANLSVPTAHFNAVPESGDGGPTLTTDKDDYQPGDTVTISGSGWLAGETVELLLEEEPATHDPLLFTSVVDDNGDFVNRDFVVQEHDLGVTFALSATGLTSGLTAGGSFTDNITGFSATLDGAASVTVAPGATISVAVSVKVTSQTPNPLYWNSTGWVLLSHPSSMPAGKLANCMDTDNVTGTGGSGTSATNTFNITAPATPGTYDLRLKLSDVDGTGTTACGGGGNVAEQTVQNAVVVQASTNSPPTAEAGGPYTGDEGSPIALDGSGSSDDGTIVSYSWSLGTFTNANGGSCQWVSGVNTGATPSVICNDNGTLTVTLMVTDDEGAADTDDATVTVSNVNPDVTITAPTSYSVWPITGIAGVTDFIDASFTDAGTNDTHTCSIDWGNATSTSGAVAEAAGSGTCKKTPGSNPYSEAGIYTIIVSVTDDDGGTGADTVDIVVYDPSAGFVTGGGWIDSPAGAYKDDLTLTGKATFGFVSKYKKGATKPDGNTEFVFHAAGLNFHSENYEWLVVNQAGTNAQFKGSGTINGEGDYKFTLWATDGSPDTFRIRIWWEDATEHVVYDNGFSQPIGSGSIVIHTGGKTK